MSSSSEELAVLDTGVLVHLARNDLTGQEIERRYSLSTRVERPLLASIVEGEILAFARYSGWGEQKMKRLQELLRNLVPVSVGHPEVVKASVDLYCVARCKGRESFCRSSDFWIAATAKATGAVLYTCDKDFKWLHPQYLTVYYIAESI